MSSNGDSVKINKIPLVGDNQHQSSNILTTSSNQTSQERTKTTKTHYPTDTNSGKPSNDQTTHKNLHQNKNDLSETTSKQLLLPDLPMTLGGVSTEVKNSNLTRSVSLLNQQQKLNNGISSKSNSPLATLNLNEFDDYQKSHAKPPVPKIKNPISSNKANLSYMTVSKDQDLFERSGSKSTNKSNYNGKSKYLDFFFKLKNQKKFFLKTSLIIMTLL